MESNDKPLEYNKEEYPHEYEFELGGFWAKAVGQEPITTEQKAWLIETVTNRFTKSRDSITLHLGVIEDLLSKLENVKNG